MASLIFERISSSSSSYSSSTHGRKYDVFLSFSGEEPRHGFTDHLYEELRRKRIHVYRDDEKLQGGEVVALDLMKAIEESQYAIVVLSEKFADSKRCLDELAKIVECREKTGLSIFPVFDHVDPSDVHNQKGPFETVFAKHETDDSVTIEKKQKWMDALRDVSNISGWCLHDRSESTVIQNIVERMHSELYGEFESVSKDLVGMESSIEGVIDLLDKGSDDVRFIGIWGCGGVGKTTLAQVIYCKISNQFDIKSFICFGSDGQTKNDYLVPIQKLLLSNIFAKRELNITSVQEGKKVIKQMLCSRKVLIVLDNVNDKGQLDAIAESHGWFGAGSRLIITSRDKQLLTSCNVEMYEAKTLNNDKALELFSRKAFKQPHPKKYFLDLSKDFVKYAQGLPLSLEVFGSSLHKEGIESWKIFLDQLNENSSGEIMERLEISYKRILDQKAKELFLDIAFFFKGMDKNRVAKILNDPSYWKNIDILKKKSLITILGRKIWMHDLLQEMGREIVRCEAPQGPGIRSRLWHHKDIFSILKNNTGTKRVEGMMLNCPPNKEDLNANCFSEMTRLRLINICNVLLPHGLNYLSNELQMMEWNDYPLKSMPRNFRPNNLVELIMHHSHIEQLPEEFTNLDQLKLMDLSYSQNLIKTPDFIGFRNLERLIFQGCTRLYKVQPSVVALRWLTLLNLKDCKHLKSLPYEIDLESLEFFILSGCSRLKKFSEIGRNMTRLSELYLDGTAIEELPPSIKHLTGLTLLNLKDCNDLLSFPSVFCSLTSLEILTLSGCRGRPRKPLHLLGLSPMASSIGVNLTFKGTILLLVMSFLVLPYNYLSIFVCATLIIWTYCFLNARYPEPEPINLLLPKSFSGLSSLKSLDLSDCNLSDGALPEDLSCLSSLRFLNLSKNNFTFLPDSISQLSKLKLLCLDNCSNLQSLPYLPSSTNFVMARGCTSLENYSKKVVVWTSGETGFTFINCVSLVEEEDKITEVSLLGSLLEDEGSKRTEVSLLDIHFQQLWQRYMEDQIRESEGFCCVLPQSEITEWFKNQNCGSYVSIPLHRYNISLRGIALCVDFEVHKNSNEVSPGQDAKFICRLYMDGAPIDPIVYTVPRDKICVGSFGIWLYVSHNRIREVDQCDCIRPLIRTNCAGIEIKRCGARILYESDVVGFVQHLSQNIFGSPDEIVAEEDCTSPENQNLAKLRLLDLRDSKGLVKTPSEINLLSLVILILSGCSSLKKFSKIGTNMTRLLELYLDGTAVEELPSSLEPLTGLTVLSLQGCKSLSSLPSVNFPSLKTLNLSGYKVQPPKSWLSLGFSLLLPRLRFIVSLNLGDRNLWDGGLPDDLSGLSSLQELDLSKNNFTRLPDSISQLSKLKYLKLSDCSRLQSLPNLPLSVGCVTARRCPLLEKYSNQFVVWTSGETGFTLVDCDNQKDEDRIAPVRIPSLPYNFDPVFERFVEGVIHQNNIFSFFSNSTETPRWFSHQSPGSSVTIPLPSNLRGDSDWIGIALFIRVVILENLNYVSPPQGEVSIDFVCRSDIIEGPRISCGHISISKAISKGVKGPLFYASSYGLKVLIPAGKLRDHLKDCSCISAFIRQKCTFIEIESCAARVLYKQELVKFINASGEMEQKSKCHLDKVESSRLCQEAVHQNKSFYEFSNSTEIPEWFSHQNLGSSIRMPLPWGLHDNSSWIGIALFAVVVVHKKLHGQDYKVIIKFNCRSDMVQGPIDRRPLVCDISEYIPEPLRRASSFSFKFFFQAWQLRDHLKECSWISTLITSDSPYVKIKMCGAGVVYKQDLEKLYKLKARSSKDLIPDG